MSNSFRRVAQMKEPAARRSSGFRDCCRQWALARIGGGGVIQVEPKGPLHGRRGPIRHRKELEMELDVLEGLGNSMRLRARLG